MLKNSLSKKATTPASTAFACPNIQLGSNEMVRRAGTLGDYAALGER